ncbi:MAG: DUF445 family protein [Eubacteriales bacterium]|nr:DUF445 family protein [Eubacteriales bacterium]
MDWIQILAGPVIGAVIGYFTNYIAVKMMFRPLKPIKFKNYTLPFTPGIIPKGKDRLARALGEAVGENLLTEQDMEEALLSEEMKEMIEKTVANEIRQDQKTVMEHMNHWMTEEKTKKWNELLTDKITQKIVIGLQKVHIGDLIAEEGGRIIKEKAAGTFFSMMLNDNLIQSIVKPVGTEAEKYIEEHGEEKIKPVIGSEIEEIENKRAEELMEDLGTGADQAGKAAAKLYEEVVRKKGKELIGKIHVSEIVESKVKEMDVLELEKLLLSIMKKELNAVVNLGAVIGFVIGCVNLLF